MAKPTRLRSKPVRPCWSTSTRPTRPRPPQLLPLHLLPLRLLLLQGQAVKSGDILVILEAMKMENEILAPRDGTVAQVVTSKGAVVETGAPLVVLA